MKIVRLIALTMCLPLFVRAEVPPTYGTNYATKAYQGAWDAVLSGAPEQGNNCPVRRLSWDDGALRAAGPWCIDINHVETAPLFGPAVIWTGKAKVERPDGIVGIPDLTNATIHVDVHFKYVVEPSTGTCRDEADITKTAEMVFWFQTELPPRAIATQYAQQTGGNAQRTVNYAFRKKNLWSKALKGEAQIIQLTADMRDWTCLGRNQAARTNQYTCAMSQEEFGRALSAVNLDMGLLVLLPDGSRWLSDSAPAPTPTMCSSSIALKNFAITKGR